MSETRVGSIVKFLIKNTALCVNVPSADQLFALVRDRFDRGAGFSLATLNLDHLVKLQSSAAFLEAYAKHDFVVADGNPIVWLSKLAGKPVQLVPGSELVRPLADMAAQTGVKVALFGSTETALAEAASALQAECPGLDVVCQISPDFGFSPDGTAAQGYLRDIHASGAGLCFLALGAPKQEVFAALGRELAPNTGFVSIGAGLDFIAGSQTRAPKWVQRLAMEWLWRMTLSPARLVPRYARCFAILPKHAWNAWRMRRG